MVVIIEKPKDKGGVIATNQDSNEVSETFLPKLEMGDSSIKIMHPPSEHFTPSSGQGSTLMMAPGGGTVGSGPFQYHHPINPYYTLPPASHPYPFPHPHPYQYSYPHPYPYPYQYQYPYHYPTPPSGDSCYQGGSNLAPATFPKRSQNVKLPPKTIKSSKMIPKDIKAKKLKLLSKERNSKIHQRHSLPSPLETDEDVTNWIKERKQRYPTMARIQENLKKIVEESGETLKDKNIPHIDEPKNGKRLCKYYRNGACRSGNDCSFSHMTRGKVQNDQPKNPISVLDRLDNEKFRIESLLSVLVFLRDCNFKISA